TIKFAFPLNTGDQVAYSPPAGDTLVEGLQPFQFVVSKPTFTRAADSSSNDTISRSDGRTWTADGVRAGTQVLLTNAVAPANNGLFTVQSVSADGLTLTLTVSGVLTTESPDAKTVTFQLPRSYRVVIPGFTTGPGASLTFARNASGDTITRGDGLKWADEGFVQGATILVQGSGTRNGGTYTVQSLSGTVLTLTAANAVTAETVASGATVTEQGVIRLGATFDATKVDFDTD